jgi:hypothetical protein
VPAEILYDRMKTSVLCEVDDQGIAYNRPGGALPLSAESLCVLPGKDQGQGGAPVREESSSAVCSATPTI